MARPLRPVGPPLPEDVLPADLDRTARRRLLTLSKENAERVARHLVMVGRLLDDDPEAAYEHAQEAVRRGGRVDVVREAAGLAAYRAGKYAEALRELRTVRRINGSSEHLAVMADCERGLGRPERAIALAEEPEAAGLDPATRVELAIVVSGARLDLGQSEAAVAVLTAPELRRVTGEAADRVAEALVTALEAAGRHDEAAAVAARVPEPVAAEPEVEVYDLLDEPGGGGGADSGPAGAPTGRDETPADAHETPTHQEDVSTGVQEPTAGLDAATGVDDATTTTEDAR